MLREKAIEKTRSEKPAIVVKNVTKEFIIPHERKTTLFENIKGAFNSSTYEKFVALKDVSFTVNRGDSIGIIGDNGSGKSTLLKIIAKILRPTSGSIEVNGRITPFLELGVGFQPDLTARENIDVYSTIMGLSDKEIAKNIDGVLEFAGLTKFADTKLKNFSSGMQVRLAFATAIQREPEILLVDEVLAVGDMDFQQKCLDVFMEYKKKSITMLFVSHDLSSVRRFCDKTLLMNGGRLIDFEATNEVIDRYVYGSKATSISGVSSTQEPILNATKNNAIETEYKKDGIRHGNRKVEILKVQFIDKYDNNNDKFNTSDPIKIKINYRINEPVNNLIFGIAIYSENDIYYYGTNTDIEDLSLRTSEGEGAIEIIIPEIPLLSGRFFLTVAAHAKDNSPYDWHDKQYSFTVVNTDRTAGIIDLKSQWNINV